MGDNLYPVNATGPTNGELQEMMGLFESRENIRDLPIYAVRGNHDCYYNKETLLNLSKNASNNWNMPYFYYAQEFLISNEGHKLGALMVDSCLLLCSNYSYGPVNLP